MAPPKVTAQSLLGAADKKAASSVGWFTSNISKWEEAGDLYQQAANAFKIEKLFKEAGDAHSREAECRENSEEPNEAGNAWWNAAKAYSRKDEDVNLAIAAFNKTIEFLTKAGRFRQAADRQKDIAKLYIKKGVLEEASNSYVKAGEWYENEGANATASQSYKEAADLYVALKKYSGAIELYTKVAKEYSNSNLTKLSVKDHMLRAGFCALAMGETAECNKILTQWLTIMGDGVKGTREYKFLEMLKESYKDGKADEFTAILKDYDQISRLSDDQIAILTKIKNSIPEEPSIL